MSDMLDHRPAETQFVKNGLSYKIGLHGVIFVWIDNHWVRSTKTECDLKGKTISRFRTYSG